MSAHPPAPARQQEIDHEQARPTSGKSRRAVAQRVGQAAVALGMCAAITSVVTAGGAHAIPRHVPTNGRPSPQQLAREINALEAKGYKPVSCTVTGTAMRNTRTGQLVTITW